MIVSQMDNFIVAPFTGTQSLQISDVFQINSIIEGVASSGTHLHNLQPH